MLDLYLKRYPFTSTYFCPPPDDGDEDEDEEEKPPAGGGKKNEDPPADEDPAKDRDKWKALARKHEKAAEAGKEAMKKLKEMEDADKTELQKLQEKTAASEAAAANATMELTRIRVALRKGLTESQAKRLQGSTEEELEADADEFLKDLAPKGSTEDNSQRRTPQERLRSGNKPQGEPEGENDPRKLAAQVSRR